MFSNPFLYHLIRPQAEVLHPSVYLGMGFVGGDNEVGELGFQMVLFLWFAEQARQALGAPGGTIFLHDRPHGVTIDSSRQTAQLHMLLGLRGYPWKIVKCSELFGDRMFNKSYEDTQTFVTATLLGGGGYQVGWVYPYESPDARDELYFARYFLVNSERRDIGFVLGEFPTLISGGTPGPPYLVKKRHEKSRLLLVESEASLKRKLFGDGNRPIRVKNKVRETLSVLMDMGIIPPQDIRFSRERIEALFAAILRLSHLVGGK